MTEDGADLERLIVNCDRAQLWPMSGAAHSKHSVVPRFNHSLCVCVIFCLLLVGRRGYRPSPHYFVLQQQTAIHSFPFALPAAALL
jgi:hypothetical protein